MARTTETPAKQAPKGGARRAATRAPRQSAQQAARAAGTAQSDRARTPARALNESRRDRQQVNTGENGSIMANHRIEEYTQVSEEIAQTLRDTYQTVVESTVAAQERNVRFAQSLFENSIEELRSQTETARAVWQAWAAQSEKQREAFQSLAHESVDAYAEFLTSPWSLYRKGFEAMQEAAQAAQHLGDAAAR